VLLAENKRAIDDAITPLPIFGRHYQFFGGDYQASRRDSILPYSQEPEDRLTDTESDVNRR
jgi:hypothetical protein